MTQLFTYIYIYIYICCGSVLFGKGLLLPPATKLGQGYVFTGVCDSVHRGEYLTRYIPPGPGTTPQDQVHLPDQVPPPGPGTAPPDQVHPPDQVQPPGTRETRSTRERYASYWNAILFTYEFYFNFIVIYMLRECTV